MFLEVEVHVLKLVDRRGDGAIDGGLYGCVKRSLCRELCEDRLKLLR